MYFFTFCIYLLSPGIDIFFKAMCICIKPKAMFVRSLCKYNALLHCGFGLVSWEIIKGLTYFNSQRLFKSHDDCNLFERQREKSSYI